MTGLTSRQRPVRTRSTTKLMKPKPKPVAMLKVRGMAMMVRKAGMATLRSRNLICTTSCIIRAPTSTSTGAVA